MYWSNCAKPEIMQIDTLPSRSILNTSRQWQRSPSFTFTASSRLPMVERQQCTCPSEELKGLRISSDQRTSVLRKSASRSDTAASVRSAVDLPRSSVKRQVRFSIATGAERLGYRAATSS